MTTRARHSSRRLFVVGLSAVIAAAPLTVVAGQPFHDADRAFITWLGASSAYNRQENGVDFETDPAWLAVQGAERDLYTMTATPMSLAAVTLMQISYEKPQDIPPADMTIVDLYDTNRERMRVLECVRPLLSGLVGRCASDLLDNPYRPLGESLLSRLRNGGAS